MFTVTIPHYLALWTLSSLVWAACVLLAYRRRIIDRPIAFFSIATLFGVPVVAAAFCGWDYRPTLTAYNFALEASFGYLLFVAIGFVPCGVFGLLLHRLTAGHSVSRIETLGCRIHVQSLPASPLLQPGAKLPRARRYRYMHGVLTLLLMAGSAGWTWSLIQAPQVPFREQPYVQQVLVPFGLALIWLRR